MDICCEVGDRGLKKIGSGTGPRAAATAQRILSDPPPALAALSADDIAALTRIFATWNAKSRPLATDR